MRPGKYARDNEPDLMGGRPAVSIIIPARNAAATLPATLRSALSQEYDGRLEVIVADGSDTAAVAALVGRCFPQVRVVPNPERSTPCALNRALAAAAHAIIVRCDAGCVLPTGYVERAVKALARTGAANVGGRQHPVGRTRFERAVALAMTSPLGAGGPRYRLGGATGPVDTVYLGVFRRAALEAVGGYDPTLLRNQDYELNWRLRQRGETVWFAPELAVDYRPRGSLTALARQYFEYGFWKRIVLHRHPTSLKWRQLAPPLLLLGLTLSAVLGGAGAALATSGATALGNALLGAAVLAPCSYLLLLLGGAAVIGLRRRCRAAVLLPLVLACMHLCWAAGFLRAGANARARSTGTARPGDAAPVTGDAARADRARRA